MEAQDCSMVMVAGTKKNEQMLLVDWRVKLESILLQYSTAVRANNRKPAPRRVVHSNVCEHGIQFCPIETQSEHYVRQCNYLRHGDIPTTST